MRSCSGCGTKAVRGNTSLLPSLAVVKVPSGYAVPQNSKSDPVQGLIVLELDEGPTSSLVVRATLLKTVEFKWRF